MVSDREQERNGPDQPTPRYRAVEETPNGWCKVVGDPMPRDSGPWRYLWEAQEYADDLNAGRVQP